MILHREPVAIAAALRAVLLALMAFGLRVSAEQLAAVMLAVEAILGVVTRQRVAPVQGDDAGGDGGQASLWLIAAIVFLLGVLCVKAGVL